MINPGNISKITEPLILKGTKVIKRIVPSSPNVKSCKSMYDKNGLSAAMAASRMPDVGLASRLLARDLFKLAHSFKSMDPDIRIFMKNLSKVIAPEQYMKLTYADKKVFNATAFLNTYIKKNGVKPSELTLEVKSLIKGYAYDPRIESRITGILQNSNFLDVLQKRNEPTRVLDSQNFEDWAILKDFGIKLRKPGDINVYRLLMEKGFIEGYDPAIHSESVNVLEKLINRIHQGGIWLPVTKIPNASAVTKPAVKIGSGAELTENIVIDLAADNLEKMGFGKGVSKETFSTIGHAVDNKDFSPELMEIITDDSTDALLSASYFEDGKFPTFLKREYGFFMDVDPGNISMADNENMASGFAKDFIDFKNSLLNSYKPERQKFAKNMREHLAISDKEYPDIYHQLVQSRTVDEIKDPKLRDVVSKAVEKTVINPKGEMNEVVVYSPSITALFSKTHNIEEIPFKLRKYAQDKDIPIIDISKFV